MRRSRQGAACQAHSDRPRNSTDQKPETLDELFASLRSGAANVAGVSYQTCLAADLLAAGHARAEAALPIVAIRPEGFEDIDCLLDDGSWIFVQSKQRKIGGKAIAQAELVEILTHAAKVFNSAQSDATQYRGVAVVTDGKFGSSLPSTGWDSNLLSELSKAGDSLPKKKRLLNALGAALTSNGVVGISAEDLIARTHLVTTAPDLSLSTETHLSISLGLHLSVSALLRAQLVHDLTMMSAQQRGETVEKAKIQWARDLDNMASRLLEQIDVSGLDEAVVAGICEPADFMSESGDSRRSFLEGISVVPNHIVSNLDVLRPEETTQILKELTQSKNVVIAGPSGSGKSALLWRTAHTVSMGPRIVRVQRLPEVNDAQVLIRHVRRLLPSKERPILVCADNLGQSQMAAWPAARDSLLELAGVSMLGACRQEDMSPEVTRGAVVVDPVLRAESAAQIYKTLVEAGLPTRMEPEEAISRADGLLMEFIALATTGRRLREVLRDQVLSVAAHGPAPALRILRLVCAAHTLGHSVPADSLPSLLDVNENESGVALRLLQHEHLATTTDGIGWRALHDLRAEIILDVLHETPPPTLASTYASVLSTIPAAEQPAVVRRAAGRICRIVAGRETGAPRERLSAMQRALGPLANFIGNQLKESIGRQHRIGEHSDRIRAFLETAERLDALAYVHASLPVVAQHKSRDSLLSTAFLLAFSASTSKIFRDSDSFRNIQKLGALLPAWQPTAIDAVRQEINSDALADILIRSSSESALKLCESAEGLLALNAEQARTIYAHHVACLPDPLGSVGTTADAEYRARFVASLALLASLDGPQCQATFGETARRAADVVAADPYGVSVEVSYEPIALLGESTSALARTKTYDTETFCRVRAVAFIRLETDSMSESTYTANPGSDPTSINSQVMLMCRRLFDACPEADVVEAELWHAHARPYAIGDFSEGIKRVRAGVVPRYSSTRRNKAVQAAVVESQSAENWTLRCRQQAMVSSEIQLLLESLPLLFRRNPSNRARREWFDRVQQVAFKVADLPGLPLDMGGPTAHLITQVSGADAVDEAIRNWQSTDYAKKALDLVSSCLSQVASGIDDSQLLHSAGSRLQKVSQLLDWAWEDGRFPKYAGIGSTLPLELKMLCELASRFLTTLNEPLVREYLNGSSTNLDELAQVLDGLARRRAEDSLSALIARLASTGVKLTKTTYVFEQEPVEVSTFYSLHVAVPLEAWETAYETLRTWEKVDREEARFRCKLSIVVDVQGSLAPIGAGLVGHFVDTLPLQRERIFESALALEMPVLPSPSQDMVQRVVKDLMTYSYQLVRGTHRTKEWYREPPSSVSALAVRDALEAEARSWAECSRPVPQKSDRINSSSLDALLELAIMVSEEDGRKPGLASEQAEMDPYDLSTAENSPQLTLLGVAMLSATEADRT